MILRLICPSGHVLDVDAQLAGRKIRCGGCGKIMIVPTLAKRPASKPLTNLEAPPQAPPPASPPAKAIEQPQTASQATRPTVEPPPALPPDLPREEEMVAVPLPPRPRPERAAPAVARRRIAGRAFFSRLRKLWPPASRHLPADATIPGKAERRIALRLAAVPTTAALVSLLPVLGLGHTNLLAAPPWVLAAVFLAVLQVVYAVWMINVPDWAAARVQMVVCAIFATIYGMLMTLTMITPVNHPLILGLGEVRRTAPAWCGLMFVLLGAATWFCGRTSTRWRTKQRDLLENDHLSG